MIYSPETKEELTEFLKKHIPVEGFTIQEFCRYFKLYDRLDQNMLYSKLGLVGKFSVKDYADLIWERSNYGEAEF